MVHTELLSDTRPYSVRQVEGVELLLARGMRVSGDPRIEHAVLTGVGLEPKNPPVHKVAIGIGGSATYENVAVFVDHLKGERSPVIVSTPTAIPEYQFGNYREQMMHAGSGEPFHVGMHSLPFEAQVAFRLGDGNFTTGGNQKKGRWALEKKGLIDQFAAAEVVAGTSAGWHMIGAVTSFGREMPIGEGHTPSRTEADGEDGEEDIPEPKTIVNEIIQGVGVTKRICGDSHFRQRSRNGRAYELVATMTEEGTDVVDIGVSEESGVIIVDDRYVEPFGSSDASAFWQRNGVVDEVIFERGQSHDILSLPRETTYYSFSNR